MATLTIALFVIVFGTLTRPRPLSETVDECEFSDEFCRDAADAKDPEILSLVPVDPGDDSDDILRPSHTTKDDLDYPYDPPTTKDPELDPANDEADMYTLTIRCVRKADGSEICQSRTMKLKGGERFSVSVPHIADYQPNVTQIADTMPHNDLVYTVYYYEVPRDLPSPSDG